ncbi:IMP cyclohydrolase [Desulfovibrio litoralis]|uniref:Phosphoribosylaminoimidazolecarboxamide formyltransferase / IMP cyclohydrolase n=1 Tax=Desulfovibrio litoralis DSM 11393 TaxID=1121455 RepID=A0A1M7TCX8_9BACT|nr:IMP cyclohydrolase [Desulfovibrio litoralis]SHN68518.1 phosphoribosylaminoimidazolecarboxamide formyltransferase / IMP cyclohydrolase [Desulfovibrio litoralis DSM 11393]
MDNLLIKRAILSVTDKSGLVPFATFLADNNVELVSTGGTAKTLKEAGLKVTLVEEVTGFPEIMGGRVKTLNPHIHGGILADKDNPDHLETLAKHKIKTFDLVCINLYNFAEAASKGLKLKEAIEQIDIGGPCMLRAAAKNFSSVLVVPETCYYSEIQKALSENKMQADIKLRLKLATKTFELTSNYDAMITKYMKSFI